MHLSRGVLPIVQTESGVNVGARCNVPLMDRIPYNIYHKLLKQLNIKIWAKMGLKLDFSLDYGGISLYNFLQVTLYYSPKSLGIGN